MLPVAETSVFPCHLSEFSLATETELMFGFPTQMPGWHLAPQSQSALQLTNHQLILDLINSQNFPIPCPIMLSSELLPLQRLEQVQPMNYLNGMPDLGFWQAPIESTFAGVERNDVVKVHEFDRSLSFPTFSFANFCGEETRLNPESAIIIPPEITTPLLKLNPISEYSYLYETLLQQTAFDTNAALQQVLQDHNFDRSGYNNSGCIEVVDLPEIMPTQDQNTKTVASTKFPGNNQKFEEEMKTTLDCVTNNSGSSCENGSRKVQDSVQRMTGKRARKIGNKLRSMECAKNEDLRFKCKHCSYASKRSDHFKSHMLTHTGEKRYKCDQCPYVTAHSGNLYTHIRAHNGEKPYKCDYCPYASSYRSHLQTHIRNHTGEKPYKCTQCLYATADSSCLRTHMRVHTGEKPYKCNQCSYATTYNSNLKEHQRHHSGKKSFKCSKCSFTCAFKRHLKVHVRNGHGQKCE